MVADIAHLGAQAEGIVRALAASEAPWGGEGIEAGCGLCNDLRQWPTDDPQDLAIHEPTCPWRLAREWVVKAGGPDGR